MDAKVIKGSKITGQIMKFDCKDERKRRERD